MFVLTYSKPSLNSTDKSCCAGWVTTKSDGCPDKSLLDSNPPRDRNPWKQGLELGLRLVFGVRVRIRVKVMVTVRVS